MPVIARLVALLLAAVWLPMSMHCDLARLEIGGELAGCCDDHSCSGGDCGCQSEVCNSIESGHFDLLRHLLVDPAPDHDCVQLTAGLEGPRQPARLWPGRGSDAPESARPWQFVLRAAPEPRAPSRPSC